MRLNRSLWAVLLLTPSVAVAQGEVLEKTLMHDGVQREYLLHVPSSYSTGAESPLVLGLHGLGQNGRTQMNASRMNAISEREGFIVAYPSAMDGSWGNSPDINLSFFDALLGEIDSEYSIDASRIYSTGLSQGAIRSYMLAVERPDVFAAVAPVAGVRPILPDGSLFPAGLPNLPERPFPLMHVHGTMDSVVPIEGGQGISRFPALADVLAEWAAHNGCHESPLTSAVEDPRPTDSYTVTLHSYQDCESYATDAAGEQLAEVEFYEIDRGGHYWPNDPTLDASEAVWEFFSRHQLPQATPIAGDFNEDGMLDNSDIDLIGRAMGQREPSFDLTEDGIVDERDRDFWVTELKQTYFGDANLDGKFDSGDLVEVFQRGHYEDGLLENSGWLDGDWSGDREFDSADIVLAFQSGGYEAGPRTMAAAVPEPSTVAPAWMGMIWLLGRVRRSTRQSNRRATS